MLFVHTQISRYAHRVNTTYRIRKQDLQTLKRIAMFDEHILAVGIILLVFYWAHHRGVIAEQREKEIQDEKNKMYSEQEWFK